MCTRQGILDVLAEHGPCDIHTLQRWVHAGGHRVTFMATFLHELIRESKVAVSCGQYSLTKEAKCITS